MVQKGLELYINNHFLQVLVVKSLHFWGDFFLCCHRGNNFSFCHIDMKPITLTCLLFLFLGISLGHAQVIISGTVTDSQTGEALIGVPVFNATKKTGTVTNTYGFYSLDLLPTDTICVQYLGYTPQKYLVGNGGKLNVKLVPQTNSLNEVEIKVTVNKAQNLSAHAIDVKLLNNLPALGGERDVIKAAQLLPGVKRGADGTVGMLVRGGAADQNLILLDDAPVYNSAHLLGIFSLFNSDAVKNASIVTGGFGANYGGRLSSVLAVTMNEGNREKYTYSGNVGVLASRLCVQGPLFKQKGSFLVAGRISYINKVFELAKQDLPFYFYDLNVKLNYELTKRDQLLFSSYLGDDILNASDKDTSGDVKVSSYLGNKINSLRWNHLFANQRTFSNLTLFTSTYRYEINGAFADNSMQIKANIADEGLRYQLEHHVANNLQVKTGFDLIQHHFTPGSTKLIGSFNDNIKSRENPIQHLHEGAFYVSTAYQYNKKLQGVVGVRTSWATAKNVNYLYPEPRATLTYKPAAKHTFQVSYARMVQYMFLLSGSSVMLPTDLWYGVSSKIKPQLADVYTAGYEFKNATSSNKFEVYYKPMQNLVEYKEGAIDIAASDANEIAVQGKGVAYGFEYSVNWKLGKTTVIATYTLAWSNRTFADLNDGKTYLARFDRRHDFNIVLGYDFSKRIAITALWSFASGSRFTPVIGKFLMPSGNLTQVDVLPIYGSRNSIQLAACHKLDINLVIKSKPSRKFQSEWHIGAYNVYNQTQPYRIKASHNADGTIAYKQVGLFGFIPTIAYRFTI